MERRNVWCALLLIVAAMTSVANADVGSNACGTMAGDPSGSGVLYFDPYVEARLVFVGFPDKLTSVCRHGRRR